MREMMRLKLSIGLMTETETLRVISDIQFLDGTVSSRFTKIRVMKYRA